MPAKTILVDGRFIFPPVMASGRNRPGRPARPRVDEKRLDYSVANLSISGKPRLAGVRDCDAALKQSPAVVVIALGANDGLRGLPLAQMRDNLRAMIGRRASSGAAVALAGMRLPPNLRPLCRVISGAVLATSPPARKCPLVEFLLEPVAAQQRYFQADNLHPVAEAQPPDPRPRLAHLAPVKIGG